MHARAQSVDGATAVRRLFDEGPSDPSWFGAEFLAAIPVSRIDGVVNALKGDFGALVDVTIVDGEGAVQLERAIVPVSVKLNGAGQIVALLFKSAEPTDGSAADIASRLVEAGVGAVSVLAITEGEDVVAIDADVPMAVGSAFKLTVLAAYEDAVRAGTLSREHVVQLEEGDRALPSGVLHTLAAGTPLTLDLLAALMIQHSDNTATDVLMRVLGRGAVEQISPRNEPFLTTAELFKLAATKNAALREVFAAAMPEERRSILKRLAAEPLPSVTELTADATWPQAEWWLSARELCALLQALSDAPALNGTPHPLVDKVGLAWAGFKGGSEFGVLNLSAAGVTADGRQVCAVMTANGEAVQPEDRLALLFGALFGSLANGAK